MLKKHMAAYLVVTAFAAAPALAQTSPSAPTDRPTATGSGSATSGSPAMQPGAPGSSSTVSPSATSPSAAAPSASSSAMNQSGSQGQFMTRMEPNQMMASDVIGTRVVSTNNESIGDINDVVVDRNGQVMAVVVGVGGFLGIGEKNVAVPFDALEFAGSQQANAMGNAGGNVSTTGSTASGSTSNSNMATNNATAGSGNAASSHEPDRVILRMTKAELQAAPAFKAKHDDNANRSTTGSSGAGGNTTQQ